MRKSARAYFACVLMIAGGSYCRAQERQLQPGEREIYDAALKDINGANFPQATTDLDSWAAKFPDSSYKDDRTALYVQVYAASNQPAKAIDAAGQLLSRDLSTVFAGPAGQGTVIRVLYSASWAITQTKDPTESQLTIAGNAARQLRDYDQIIAGVTGEKWAEARADMRTKATAALLYIGMLPGMRAMAKDPPDCAAAEQAYSRVLQDYPDRTAVSYELGRALNCEAKQDPSKLSLAVYEFLRAAVVDPTLGNPANDAKKIQAFATRAYVSLHGSEEGLEQLRQRVKESALPPSDWQIKTAGEIADAERMDFEKAHPQVALWMKIREALANPDGAQYFESQLKNSAVPQLTGTLVKATPACRPKELVVAVASPDGPKPAPAEITLRLSKALSGSPDTGVEFQWEGVPEAFSGTPFMLTMDVETEKLQALPVRACAAMPARKK